MRRFSAHSSLFNRLRSKQNRAGGIIETASKSLSLSFKKGLLASCILAMPGLSQAEDLAHIYQLAAENDHEFKAAQAAYHAGKEYKNIQRAGLLPAINASYTIEDSSTDTAYNNAVPAQADYTTDYKTKGYAVTLAQPLFDLNAWNQYKSGKAQTSAAKARFETAEQDLIIRSAEVYFAALEASDNYHTSVAEVDALGHQLEQTRQRFEVGLSAITEVHEAQARYDSAIAEQLITEGQLAIAFDALEVLTGEAYEQLAPVKESFKAIQPEPLAQQAWVDRALENNYTLSAVSADAKYAKYKAKAAASQHLPTIDLSASYSSGNEDIHIAPNNFSDYDNDTKYVALTLSVPIFNGGGVSASRRQAKQIEIQSREQLLGTQRSIVQQTRSQHLSVVTGVATVKARQQAIVSTTSALDATQAGYSVGTRDLVDVLNAQRSLFQAKRAYYTALYEYIISSLKLKESAGMLIADDIVQLNSWLDNARPVYKTPRSSQL